MNRITSLLDDDNIRVTEEEKLCDVAKKYFTNLFLPQVSYIAPIIKTAVFSMKTDKCPGLEGFN